MSSLKPLSPQEWDSLIDDYQTNSTQRLQKWATLNYTGLSLLDLSLSSLSRKDFSLSQKLNLVVFIEEYLQSCFQEDQESEASSLALTRLLDSLRLIVQAPIDGVSVTLLLKEQFLICVTSVFVSCVIGLDGKLSGLFAKQLEGLIELLFSVINRPNHGVDRQTRAVGCECLRELERACPCLLSEVAGNLWSLCQSERTHAAQSYVLLLAQVIHGVVVSGANVSIVNSSMPLVPFNVPEFITKDGGLGKEFSDSNYKEFRRVMAFLLEWPQYMTPFGLLEFMTLIMTLAAALELQTSLLKVQFSGLIYTYDPLLCHAFLGMYSRFLDAFDGQENEIASRLVLISREAQHSLVFRLLALHWLQGFIELVSNKEAGKKKTVVKMSLSFYPSVFDPLALKSLKLDLLAYSSVLLDTDRSKVMINIKGELGLDSSNVVNLFKDGLVSVSSFKWLPPWSTETAVAFRAFHKFLIGASSHYDTDSSTKVPKDSTIFHTVQSMLVEMALEFQGLVPVIVAFVDRLLACYKHQWLGERLLQTFDEILVPKLKIEYRLGSYFPLFDRIAGNDTVPPGGILELFAKLMMVLVEKHGPDTGLKSWSQGSKVLGMCRTMMLHHHSSRLFLGLSRLLAFTCLYFPDLEVRDSARIYLRLLICVPGKRLRHILNFGDQVPGISQSSHASSFFSDQSPQILHDPKKSKNISSYMHIERVFPLLVKQSWSLSLSTLSFGSGKPTYIGSIQDSEPPPEQTEVDSQNLSETEGLSHPQEPLRVMDSKVSEIVGILRQHFLCIPDYRHMEGLKIRISCTLRFESEPFVRTWGGNVPANGFNEVDSLPAIYAVVLTFSSSAPYGTVPSYHIPFLLGEPSRSDHPVGQTCSLEIISVENKSREEDRFKASLAIKLEPREPVPGMIDVSIETNTENGQIIRGQLQSVTVGIEDMFLKAIIPEDVKGHAVSDYYFALFSALWEACGTSASTGREIFSLKGGKGVTAINGTRSVKLLEVPAQFVIEAVERHLAPFVVSIIGGPLVSIVKDGGIISDIFWKDVDSDSSADVTTSGTNIDSGPLYLKYTEDEDDRGPHINVNKKMMGCFLILIFLPPRFHLLFQMEVTDVATLVRIRTDHWPCLAYIDDYLEALVTAQR